MSDLQRSVNAGGESPKRMSHCHGKEEEEEVHALFTSLSEKPPEKHFGRQDHSQPNSKGHGKESVQIPRDCSLPIPWCEGVERKRRGYQKEDQMLQNIKNMQLHAVLVLTSPLAPATFTTAMGCSFQEITADKRLPSTDSNFSGSPSLFFAHPTSPPFLFIAHELSSRR